MSFTPVSRRHAVRQGLGLATAGAFASVFAPRVGATTRLIRRSRSPLAVPSGFSVTVLDHGSEAPDGMGCFQLADGDWALMRNHELPSPEGGVSRLLIDPATLTVRSIDRVLTGTSGNCAGGLSPWGWLSCEEAFDNRHGYVYLCDPNSNRLVNIDEAHRIPAYGHFNHEAAAVDPTTLIAYLTEDRSDSCFYRFVPNDLSTPFAGRLEALTISGLPGIDTGRSGMRRGDVLPVTWLPVADGNPRSDTMRSTMKRAGAATFRRGEGLWLDGSTAYFTATSGGVEGLGQIFSYTPHGNDAGALTLVAESQGREEFDLPDNLTVAPWGDLFVAEDGQGEQRIQVVLASGKVVTFASNAISDSEFAGVTFSPDGSTLFMNLQWDGLTVAVRGPFEEWCRAQDA